MDAILQGLSGIFEVAVIAGLGFFLSRMGFFWESAGKDLTKFTMSVALPPLMIYSLYSNFTHDQLIETAPDMLLPFASIFVAYLAGRVLAKVLNITKGRRGVFTCTCCISIWHSSVKRACLLACCTISQIPRCSGSLARTSSSRMPAVTINSL